MMHWATPLIGIPWAPNAQGPDAFNCWFLCVHVQVQHYGRPMPDLTQAQVFGVRRVLQRSGWRMVDGKPQEGDVLSMQSEDGPHVATVIHANDRLMALHALGSERKPGSVVATDLDILPALGFGRIRVWRYLGETK